MHDGFDSHNGYDSHDKFNASGQAGKAIQTYGLQVLSLRDSVLKNKNVPVTVPTVFVPHRRLLFQLHRGATQAHRHQQSSSQSDRR